MASLEIKKLAKDALQRIREAGLKTITAIQLQQFLEVGDTTTHKIFDIFSETWKIGDKPGSLIVPVIKATASSSAPNSKLRKVSPKRLRQLRDIALEKALEDYIDGNGEAKDLAAALRGLPVDPPSIDQPALPVKEFTQEEAILTCKALLNSFGLDITIISRDKQ